ncbi:signal recognition particle receptor FtsY [Nitrospira sp.]|nr:signal recognition particle receptor FtsY [Nitrospira sp.]
MGWFDRLTDGLAKTRSSVRGSLDRLLGRGADPATLEELESVLLRADLGVKTVDRLMEQVRATTLSQNSALHEIHAILQINILKVLQSCHSDSLVSIIRAGPRPFVVLTVGVNGVGKTTTVAKIAQRLQQAGISPLLVAADTFRAAAIEQLQVWGRRIGVDVVHQRTGADPAAVVFDGLATAKSRGVDVVLIDTAGRLHTKSNLMDELKKVKRVIARELPGAPHEVLLVLDATVGQNAISQATQFHEAVGVTGIALTKLDGTARGGVVVAIAEALRVPVRLIGVGESEDDLQDFQASDFVRALLGAAPSSGP